MALRLKTLSIVEAYDQLAGIPEGKILLNTIYAYSYVVAQRDDSFAEALTGCDFLMPDGAGIVKACRWVKAKCQPKERIAGWDLFSFEMNRVERKSEALNAKGGKCLKVMFLGSSEKVLSLIRKRAAVDYPHLEIVTYSPPYREEFSDEDSQAMIRAINETNPDLLWIGMTAPKQEKWTYRHWNELNIHCHCGTIGAVFDFYAGTVRRAPLWWQRHSLEWLHRLLMEPRRTWRRYIIGNAKFLYYIFRELKGA